MQLELAKAMCRILLMIQRDVEFRALRINAKACFRLVYSHLGKRWDEQQVSAKFPRQLNVLSRLQRVL